MAHIALDLEEEVHAVDEVKEETGMVVEVGVAAKVQVLSVDGVPEEVVGEVEAEGEV